jgi:uncharacterized protein (UPF0335 family)
MNSNRLKDFADRLDRLEDEKQALMADIREVYGELKGEGYNPKAMRRVLADRRKKPDEAFLADLDLYRAALGEPGATYRAVADRLGVSKSKLQRLVPRNESGTRDTKSSGDRSGQPEDAGRVSPAPPPLDTQSENEDGEAAETADRGRDPAGLAEGAPVGEVPSADQGRAGDPDPNAQGRAVANAIAQAMGLGVTITRPPPPADLEMPPILDFLRRTA